MKKILYLFLGITLLTTAVLSVSCTCTNAELAKQPYGEVLYWIHKISDEYKNNKNVIIEPYTIPKAKEGERGLYYVKVYVEAQVVNKGGKGILTFHAACNLNTLNNMSTDAQNITLNKDQEGDVLFGFWVDIWDVWVTTFQDKWHSQAFTIQAVNPQDFVDEKK